MGDFVESEGGCSGAVGDPNATDSKTTVDLLLPLGLLTCEAKGHP